MMMRTRILIGETAKRNIVILEVQITLNTSSQLNMVVVASYSGNAFLYSGQRIWSEWIGRWKNVIFNRLEMFTF